MPMLTLSLDQIDNDYCRVYFRAQQNDTLYCYQQEGRNNYELYECTPQGEPLARIDVNEVSLYISGDIESDGTPTGDKFAAWAEVAFYMPSDVNPALSY